MPVFRPALGLCGLLGAGCGSHPPPEPPTAAPTPPAEGPTDGRILYIHEDGDAQNLWQYDFSTQKSTPVEGPSGRLFAGPADPQGGTLVIALEQGLQRLYLLPPEGGPPRLLAPPAERLRGPVWSPDGSWLYIEASWKSFGDLYRVPREGGEPARLSAEPGGSFEPSLSPDGTRLAFASSRDGNAEIYVMPAHGGPATRQSDHPADDMAPRWGADGSLYWLSRRGGAAHYWAMKPEKPAEAFPLRTAPVPGVDPTEARLEEEVDLALSADGQLGAITVQRPPNRVDITLLRLSDRQVIGGLEGEGVDEHPTFSPDGRWVVFSSGRSGDVELWIARPDGSDLRRLTEKVGADWLPRWLPPG